MSINLSSQNFTRIRVENATDSQPVDFVMGASGKMVLNATDTTHTDTGGVLRLVTTTDTTNVLGYNSLMTLGADVTGVAGFRSSVTGYASGGASDNSTYGFLATMAGDGDDTDHNYVGFNSENFTANGGTNTAIGYQVGTGYTTALSAASGDIDIAATSKFYLDGGTDTYIHESAADILDLYVGGATLLSCVEAADDYVETKVGTVYTPSSDQARADDSAITIDNTIVRVAGDGAAAVLDTDPAIEDGAADGQMVIIQGTSDANTVQIADACNTALAGGVAFTLGQNDTLQLIWDAGESLWAEVSRSDN